MNVQEWEAFLQRDPSAARAALSLATQSAPNLAAAARSLQLNKRELYPLLRRANLSVKAQQVR